HRDPAADGKRPGEDHWTIAHRDWRRRAVTRGFCAISQQRAEVFEECEKSRGGDQCRDGKRGYSGFCAGLRSGIRAEAFDEAFPGISETARWTRISGKWHRTGDR